MENICKTCGDCCNHIAIEIDKPETKDDYEDIYWYVLHNNVNIFVTENDEDETENECWFIEFITNCSALNEKKLCNIYSKRPKICSNYDPNCCVKSEGESEEIYRFNNAQDFLKYLKDKKNIIL
jgi:uncharacterized protein